MQEPDSLVSIRAEACGLVVFGAVDVGAVVESPVSSPDGSPPTLVEKMPVEARKGSVLGTLVLQEQRALLCPKLLQVSTARGGKKSMKSGFCVSWGINQNVFFLLFLKKSTLTRNAI